MVHLNKGRFHALRKLSNKRLSASDCHFKLRKQIIESAGQPITDGDVCVSVAWDWVYKGCTVEGSLNEILLSMEGDALRRKKELGGSLAQPRHHLLSAASGPLAKQQVTLLKGILPALECVIREDCAAVLELLDKEEVRIMTSVLDGKGVHPPHNMSPFGNDNFCDFCNGELANGLLMCLDCLKRHNKDTKICHRCFLDSNANNWKHCMSTDGLVFLGGANRSQEEMSEAHREVMLCYRMGTIVEEAMWLIKVKQFLLRADEMSSVAGLSAKNEKSLSCAN